MSLLINFDSVMYKEIKDFLMDFVFKGDAVKANDLYNKGVMYINEQVKADTSLSSIFEDEANTEFVLAQFLLVRDKES